MTQAHRTSLKGTLLPKGDKTRESVLSALPGSMREVADKLNLGKTTVRYTIKKLASLGVIRQSGKRLVNKNTEFIYEVVSAHIPSPSAKKVLKTFRDPQKPLRSDITPKIQQMVSKDPRNVWARPVYTPPKWEPPRQRL